MEQELKTPGRLSSGKLAALIALPIICILISLCVGRIVVPLSDVLRSIAALFGIGAGVGEQTQIVLWSVRFPRIILAALAGAGLSVAGCAFQSLFSNPLATPDTLGVASGASFGAALALLLGLGLFGVQLTALFFGLAACALTFVSGSRIGQNKTTIVLAGIMIGSLFNALLSLVKYVADTESQLPSITYWLMGSLSGAGYGSLALGAPLIIAGIIVLWLLRWQLNLLPLSDDESRSSGINMKALRLTTIICATAMTASCVSMCGQVGWVGLLIPHICRMRFGSNHLSLVPACVCTGAAFMIIVDTLARSMTASEIPVSILTAIIGAPFFIILMRKSGGWKL